MNPNRSEGDVTKGRELLGIYLNDHLAASIAGHELAKRSAKSNKGTGFGPFLQELAAEIEADQRSLRLVMDRLGVKPNPIKDSGAWLAEKIGRLKLNGSLTGYSELSRVVELEGLAVGIVGKAALWRSLKTAFSEGLDGVDLDELMARAEKQRTGVEEHRVKAAAIAFTA
jgi:hypothetical protein